MASNSPQGNCFTLQNRWVCNIFPSKKENYYSNLPHMGGPLDLGFLTYPYMAGNQAHLTYTY